MNKKKDNTTKAGASTFVFCVFILIAIMIFGLYVASQSDARHEEQEEKPLAVKQVNLADMPGIYGKATVKINAAKLPFNVTPDLTKEIDEFNQTNQETPMLYFGLARGGKIIEQIRIPLACASDGGYSFDSRGMLKRADGASTSTSATMSSANKYAKYGAFICQSHTVEIPISLPNGAHVRADLGSSYKTRADEKNGKLYMDVTWSILADGSDVYYSGGDYDGYQWTIQDKNNETIRTYLVRLIPMFSDDQQDFLDRWKSRIDTGR